MAPPPPSVVIPHTTAAEFANRKFDYLVVGGGTAGLVVAARLAGDPSLTVGVLEAGSVGVGDPAIDVPGLYGSTLGTKYDWQFETVPQPGLAGRRLPWPRGKVLGGTSALNFMTWNRPSRDDFDAWERLGNVGWGWDGLLPFYKKAETFHEPKNDQCKQENQLFYKADALGTSGPLQISYAAEYSACHVLWHDTLNSLGVETNKAHLAGSNVGAWTNMGAVDPDSMTRSYSVTGYYLPNAYRRNLVVLSEALVSEVVLSEHDGKWTATGVRFQHDGQGYIVSASKEVILSAGSVQSPQLLELSGIGGPGVLTRAGIAVKVENTNVGDHLQEHIMIATIFEVDPSLASPDDLKVDRSALAAAEAQYTTSKTGPLTILANSVCYLPLSHVIPEDALKSIVSRAESLTQYAGTEKAILDHRFKPSANLGQIEYMFDLGNWNPAFTPPPSNGKKYGTCLQMLQYPFSRGNIHIPPKGADGSPPGPLDKPLIDPKYYEGLHGEIDRDIMTHCALFADKITKTKPLADIVRCRAFPPEEVKGHEDLREWVVNTTITDWHPVGTCRMGGSLGNQAGVVDDRLRVYGVEGLRVVDASIMPLQISGHLQATVYAIAEKGAEMILEDYRAAK
ncbi:putative choline dehydrogenase [Coniochaeta ligniaria NRRL 30616]|uniref:Putative choline dehydrogenase n=1 Tax=Coniochaeta ligniaria NRRL 30616 TaxID=1408157 RepID=A0A1J7JT30_9PEZI|nr:putative choline dehydrogenase [Coniochaeta ligniaria NRRL 30616]